MINTTLLAQMVVFYIDFLNCEGTRTIQTHEISLFKRLKNSCDYFWNWSLEKIKIKSILLYEYFLMRKWKYVFLFQHHFFWVLHLQCHFPFGKGSTNFWLYICRLVFASKEGVFNLKLVFSSSSSWVKFWVKIYSTVYLKGQVKVSTNMQRWIF